MNFQLGLYQYFLLIERTVVLKNTNSAILIILRYPVLSFPPYQMVLSPLRSDVLRHILFLKKNRCLTQTFIQITNTKRRLSSYSLTQPEWCALYDEYLTTRPRGFDSRQGEEIFSVSNTSRLVPGPTQPPVHWRRQTRPVLIIPCQLEPIFF